MKVLIVLGTRPEAIKLAPVVRALRWRGAETGLCVSAQHREMLDSALAVFDLRPDYDLDVMRPGQSPTEVAARVSEKLPAILDRCRPDWLVVQGDTTTTFAAAWTAFHHRVPIAHVEAGLRTSDKYRPFPEEMNRRLTTVLTDLHLAPTARAADNLRREGIPEEKIQVTGNTVVDALLEILARPMAFADPRLQALQGRVVVVTAHRRESFGATLEAMCAAIRAAADAHPDVTFVFPLHRNPVVVDTATRVLEGHPRMLLADPMPYPEFVHLLRRADLILTDSGGIQEEAPTVGTPALVMREVTERPEAIESGWAELVGTSGQRILERLHARLEKPAGELPPGRSNPFGDGKASERIAELLEIHAAGPAAASSQVR